MERLGASLRAPRGSHQPCVRRNLAFPHSRIADKYGMRPRTIIRRLLQEKRLREAPQKAVGGKSRPQPLSKYRKKAARTPRQRCHVRQINEAFENLRNVLPSAARCRRDASAATKMTILRVALRYIAALTHLLQEDDTQRCLRDDDDDTSSSCSHASSSDDHKPSPSGSHDLELQKSCQEDDQDTYMLALAKIFDEDDSSDSNDDQDDQGDLLSS